MRDLLDILAEACGCTYISDLPHVYRHKLTAETVRALAQQGYSLHQWQDAIEYLTDERASFADAQAAWESLIARLSA